MAKTDNVSKIDPLRARRDEEKEERRQAILDAAEKVIARDGWEATNFGEIAKRARLSRSLVYFYFPARDDLFHAVCGRGLTEMEKRFAAALASARTGLEQVMAIGRAYYQFSLDEPLYFKMLADYQGRDLDPENESANEAEAHGHGRCQHLRHRVDRQPRQHPILVIAHPGQRHEQGQPEHHEHT